MCGGQKTAFRGGFSPPMLGSRVLPQVLRCVGPLALTYVTSLRGQLPGSLLLRRVLIFLSVHRYVSANPPVPVSRLEVTPPASSLQSSFPLWTPICDCIWLQLDRPNAELLGGLTCQGSKNHMQNDRWRQMSLAVEKTGGFAGPALRSLWRGLSVGGWEERRELTSANTSRTTCAEEGVPAPEGGVLRKVTFCLISRRRIMEALAGLALGWAGLEQRLI